MKQLIGKVAMLAIFGALGLGAAPPAWSAESAIGRIKTLEGDVTIQRGAANTAAEVGTEVFLRDILRTAEKSKTGITFWDHTRLAIGPRSEVELKGYEFEPVKEEYSFVTKVTRGTMHYISGLIAKLSPRSTTVETPGGTIGVRGTSFVVRVKGK